MRNFLAALLAIVTGLAAALGLVSWKLNSMIHEPEPIQDILGSGTAVDTFKTAVPKALGEMSDDATGVPMVDEVLNRAITQASGLIMDDPGFDSAWAQSLEMTRAGWLHNVDDVRARMHAGESIPPDTADAQLVLEFEPLAHLASDVVEESFAQAAVGIPGLEQISIEIDLATAVPTPIPPVSVMTAEQVVLAEQITTLWPALMGLSFIFFLMAIVVASPGSRWLVWLVTGLIGALCGAAVKIGFSWLQQVIQHDVAGAPNLGLATTLLRALQQWADPQLIVMIAASTGIAMLGILGGFIASHRQRQTY